MSTCEIVGEEIDRQAALASTAMRKISGVGAGARNEQLLPRAVFEVLGPYSAALYIAERVVESASFNVELVHALHFKLLRLERMADDMLSAARQKGNFDNRETVEALPWLENCNERVKDCMVALESMLDPKLVDLMASAMDEHERGETVPLDSIC